MGYQLVLGEEMKENKILIRVNSIEEVNAYQKKGINNFLFALNKFSIGYKSFSLEDLAKLKVNVYLLINRVFDNELIEEFKKIIPKLTFIKGIFFDDLGIYHLLINSNINLIWNQAHFVINSRSINYYLNNIFSVCLSNELTKEEIKYILKKANKGVILNVFGQNMIMYSRRYLLSNYAKFKGLKEKNQLVINPHQNDFIAKENAYGTVFFNKTYFDYIPYLNELDDKKILFYYIDEADLTVKDILKVINDNFNLVDNRFFNNKTIYKLEEK
jgi:collagenase-like PrtC family protease